MPISSQDHSPEPTQDSVGRCCPLLKNRGGYSRPDCSCGLCRDAGSRNVMKQILFWPAPALPAPTLKACDWAFELSGLGCTS